MATLSRVWSSALDFMCSTCLKLFSTHVTHITMSRMYVTCMHYVLFAIIHAEFFAGTNFARPSNLCITEILFTRITYRLLDMFVQYPGYYNIILAQRSLKVTIIRYTLMMIFLCEYYIITRFLYGNGAGLIILMFYSLMLAGTTFWLICRYLLHC